MTVQDREVEGDRETNLAVAVEGLERRMIREALAQSDGVQTRAAELLGMSERGLRYKLIKYGFREEASSHSIRRKINSGEKVLNHRTPQIFPERDIS